jgi:hypothetical protein
MRSDLKLENERTVQLSIGKTTVRDINNVPLLTDLGDKKTFESVPDDGPINKALRL